MASEISRQAALIAYINDFSVLLILGLAGIPLVLLMKRPTG
jgi:MFS transporter, DHA2 family, multidrug resistance protein